MPKKAVSELARRRILGGLCAHCGNIPHGGRRRAKGGDYQETEEERREIGKIDRQLESLRNKYEDEESYVKDPEYTRLANLELEAQSPALRRAGLAIKGRGLRLRARRLR